MIKIIIYNLKEHRITFIYILMFDINIMYSYNIVPLYLQFRICSRKPDHMLSQRTSR